MPMHFHRALAAIARTTPLQRVAPVLLLVQLVSACRTVAPSPDEAALSACDMGMNLRRMSLGSPELSRPVTHAGCLQMSCDVTEEGDVQQCRVAHVVAAYEHIGEVARWLESRRMKPVTIQGKPKAVKMVFVVRLSPEPPADGGTSPAPSGPETTRH